MIHPNAHMHSHTMLVVLADAKQGTIMLSYVANMSKSKLEILEAECK